MKLSFNMEDASQIFVGAFALAVPISFSEEAWRLGETLPFTNLIMLFILSVAFLSFFTYESLFQRNIKRRFIVFLFRIVIAYSIAALVSHSHWDEKGNHCHLPLRDEKQPNWRLHLTLLYGVISQKFHNYVDPLLNVQFY